MVATEADDEIPISNSILIQDQTGVTISSEATFGLRYQTFF